MYTMIRIWDSSKIRDHKVLINFVDQLFFSIRKILRMTDYIFLFLKVYHQGIIHLVSLVTYFIQYSFYSMLRIFILIASCQ